jgi:hypothetical protein
MTLRGRLLETVIILSRTAYIISTFFLHGNTTGPLLPAFHLNWKHIDSVFNWSMVKLMFKSLASLF